MKTLKMILAAVIFVSAVSFCQFKAGSLEVGLSGSFGSQSIDYSSSNYNNSDSYKYLIISAITSYYIIDGLAIEPEAGIFAVSETSPAQYIIGNISYTYLLKNSRFAFFGRGGYGASNSIILSNMDKPLSAISDGLKISIINIGAGFKYLISDKIALRCEVNYKIQKHNEDISTKYYNYNVERKWNTISFNYGFTLLL